MTILVVEDEWLLREMVVAEMRAAGWMVLEADNGEDALAQVDDEPAIDVVFTDIHLNGSLTGWDVGEACRGKIAGVPVIYASGRALDAPRAVVGGRLLDKPYDPKTILATCRELSAARKSGSADSDQ